MQRPFMQRHRMRIQPLSPIHIGSGETIEPPDYLLQKNSDGCWLHVLDLPRLFSELDSAARREFDRLVAMRDCPDLYGWLEKHAKVPRHVRWTIQVMEDAYQELTDSLRDRSTTRKGEIHLAVRDAATGRPCIPGSSVKGALRTAILDELLTNMEYNRREELKQAKKAVGKSSARFEAMVLGQDRFSAQADPFRQIAVSDAHLPMDGCCINRVKIVRKPGHRGPQKEKGDEDKIKLYRDVTWSSLDGEEIEAVGELRLLTGLTRAPGELRRSWSVEDICRACNDYYVEKIERELNKFLPIDAPARKPLLDAAAALGERECIVRLGRHKHFECTVFSKPFNTPPKKGCGKTRTYVDGKYPLGWAKLTFEEET